MVTSSGDHHTPIFYLVFGLGGLQLPGCHKSKSVRLEPLSQLVNTLLLTMLPQACSMANTEDIMGLFIIIVYTLPYKTSYQSPMPNLVQKLS